MEVLIQDNYAFIDYRKSKIDSIGNMDFLIMLYHYENSDTYFSIIGKRIKLINNDNQNK